MFSFPPGSTTTTTPVPMVGPQLLTAHQPLGTRYNVLVIHRHPTRLLPNLTPLPKSFNPCRPVSSHFFLASRSFPCNRAVSAGVESPACRLYPDVLRTKVTGAVTRLR